ncbi:hypothetical protein JHK82_028866 [Glycine max]|nr:hypothetical protein JHK82_028866 [Glycine max]
MNAPPHHDDEDDNEQVFLDESDIIHEVAMDNEDLPDADDDSELGELYSVSCSPTDAALVVTGSGDDRGFLWKIGQGDWAFELQGHEESVSTLAFSYDGQQLASVSLDGIIKVWDVSGNLEGRNFEGPGGGIEWLRWDPRGHRLLAGSEDFSIWMWNTDNAALLKTFIGHGNSVTCGDFTPDEFGIQKVEKALMLCRVVDNNALASHSDSIECVGFAPSGSWAAVGGMDKKLIIWDIEHLLPRGTCEHEDGVSCLAWLGASYVASGCVDGKVRLWDSRSGKCVKTLKGHSDAIQSLSVSANHDYLVSASVDGTACAFEVENFR